MPHRERPFEPMSIDDILDGIGRQQTQAQPKTQPRPSLPPTQAARPAGPLTLRLNGRILDENNVISSRELDSLRNNPGIPQLVQDEIMVSSEDGTVRVLSGEGKGAQGGRSSATDALPPVGAAPTPNNNATRPTNRSQLSTTSAAAHEDNPPRRNTFPFMQVGFESGGHERLPMVGPDQADFLFRNMINARRGALEAAKALSEFRIEPSVRERIGNARQEFGEGFIEEIDKLSEQSRNLFNTLASDPVKGATDLSQMLQSDFIGTVRLFTDAAGQLSTNAYRRLTDTIPETYGNGLRQAGVPEFAAEVAEQSLKAVLFVGERALSCIGDSRIKFNKGKGSRQPTGLGVQRLPRQTPPTPSAPRR